MTHPDQPSGAPEHPASAPRASAQRASAQPASAQPASAPTASTPPASDQRADDTAPIPWARTTTMPTVPAGSRGQVPGPVTHTAVPPAAASDPDVTAASAPALAPPVWSGRKTAIAAALAIGFSSVAAIGAAAALPAGGSQDTFGRGGPGSTQFQPSRGQLQPGGQQLPGPGSQQPGVGQVPGGTVHVPGLGGDDDGDQSDHDGGSGAGSSTT